MPGASEEWLARARVVASIVPDRSFLGELSELQDLQPRDPRQSAIIGDHRGRSSRESCRELKSIRCSKAMDCAQLRRRPELLPIDVDHPEE